MSERERRYWGPYPGEVPLSRTSRRVPPPAPEPEGAPAPAAPPPGEQDAPSAAEPEARSAPEPSPVARAELPAPPEPARPSVPGSLIRMAERGPSRIERRRDGNAMVPLLAQALSTQLRKLAADVDPVPDGWWFTPQR